ncbi:MAG: metallophosphoesterase family protein, partial [Candidatus Marsarchaeota archaeon]|nr:metallophosphoesterase family protein [Candidatus Marsarchaeota archaeon]
MKIAIVSDMHLGYERFLEDAFAQAKEALEKASAMADAIIVPGDIFDKRYPKPEIIAQAINLFRDISSKTYAASITSYTGNGRIYTKAPIIAIPGTHERIAAGKENAVQLLSLAGLLADTSEATTVISKGNEKVAVFGLGGVSDEMAKDEILRLSPKPVAGAFNIFVLHQSIYEMLPFSDRFIKYSDLPKGFDLYICGHMHSRVEAEVNGKKLLVPGSTVLTQLKGEEQGRKGFILFDTQSYEHKFISIDSRPFIVEEVHTDGAQPDSVVKECENRILKNIPESKRAPIIKLKIFGNATKGYDKIDTATRELAAKYSKKAFIFFDTQQLKSREAEQMINEVRNGKVAVSILSY